MDTTSTMATVEATHRHHGAPGHSPVLDIGGEVGALIVYLAAEPATGELFARPAGRPEDHLHTGVHPRDLAGEDHPTWVAIFPELPQGRWELLGDSGSPMAQVAIAGGEVGRLDLR